jgi:hypothetical protein
MNWIYDARRERFRRPSLVERRSPNLVLEIENAIQNLRCLSIQRLLIFKVGFPSPLKPSTSA